MTAQEANILSSERQRETQLPALYKQIKERATAGYYSCHSEYFLCDADVAELQLKGYRIERSDINKCHKITW